MPFELLAKVPASSDLQNAPGLIILELMLGVTLAEGEGKFVVGEVGEGEALCSLEIVGLGVGTGETVVEAEGYGFGLSESLLNETPEIEHSSIFCFRT